MDLFGQSSDPAKFLYGERELKISTDLRKMTFSIVASLLCSIIQF